MLNERLEVLKDLNGIDVEKKLSTRKCRLLAMYFREDGLSRRDVRRNIMTWASKNGVDISINVSRVIDDVFNSEDSLSEYIVYLSSDDINVIRERLTAYNDRLVALAIMCYSRIFNAGEEFTFNKSEFAKWIGLQSRHLNASIKAMQEAGIIKVNENGRAYTYEILIGVSRSKDYVLDDDDVVKLFSSIDWNVKSRGGLSPSVTRSNSKCKEVVQYSHRMHQMATYSSVREAARVTGIGAGNISMCCRGTRNSAGRYKWKYKYKVGDGNC